MNGQVFTSNSLVHSFQLRPEVASLDVEIQNTRMVNLEKVKSKLKEETVNVLASNWLKELQDYSTIRDYRTIVK